jgi:transcriptional regulator GlxA family with amidase domain
MDARVKHVIALFNKDLASRLSEERVSKHVNLSSARLRQLFKKETGLSPIKYLKRLRMKNAAKLLRSSFLSIKEVASQCGSGDTSHFVRDFRKHYGLRPTEFRTRSQGSRKAVKLPPRSRE